MDLVGREELKTYFQKLAKKDNLAQAYLFFGEPGVGKFYFAKTLAAFLENGEFSFPPRRPLIETLIMDAGGASSLGIELVKGLKNFLFQKPIVGAKRIAILNEAENLTSQAENAILKIVEEPPASSLIILVASTPDRLSPTLLSRLQKIYFPPLGEETVENILIETLNLDVLKAKSLARDSFGRPSRALSLAADEKIKEIGRLARQFIQTEKTRKEIVIEIAEDKETAQLFLTELMVLLGREPVRQREKLKATLECLTRIGQFNVNKRLQFEFLAASF